MRLYLIRHGETVDNVALLYSGSRDCVLTSHGVLQAQRLASHFVERLPAGGVHFFSSNLQRAAKTAQAICDARGKDEVVLQLPELREQHFGSGEGTKYGRGEVLEGVETGEEMRVRIDRFLGDQLLPLLTPQNNETPIVIVAHGILLGVLFRRLCEHLPRGAVAVTPEAQSNHPPFSYINGVPALVAWSNTGYLEADVSPATGTGWEAVTLQVHRVNSVEHLKGLHKTRGGIGSAAFDEKQKTMDSFLAPKKADASDAPQ